MGSNNKSHVKILNNDGTPVTTLTPLAVESPDQETLLTAVDTKLGLLTALIDSSSGGLKVNPRDSDGSTLAFEDEGAIAHDAADSGKPQKLGAKAIATLSGATLVAAADRTDVYADLDGTVLNRKNAAIGDYVSGVASNTDGTSTALIAAGAAGVKHAITDITIINTSASMIYVELKDDTTVKWRFPVPATGGVTHSFQTPLVGTAATAWNFDPSAATTTVYCSASGFKTKV
jgi:hypothetical protein